MNREEALKKIEELQAFIKELDSKTVKVYVKEDAQAIQEKCDGKSTSGTYGWNEDMDEMVGQVLTVGALRTDGNLDVIDSGVLSYALYLDTVVVVEGDLNCLKS